MGAEQVKAIIYEEFKAAGFSDTAINAYMARTTRESSFSPTARRKNDAGPGKDSFGLNQWNRERLDALNSFAKKKGMPASDARTQVQFSLSEFAEGGTHGWVGAKLKNAKTLVDGVDAMMMYENPKGASKRVNGKTVWTPQGGMHYKETLQAAEQFSGQKIDMSAALGKKNTVWDPDVKHNNAMNKSKQAEADSAQGVIDSANAALSANTDTPEANGITSETIAGLVKSFMPNANAAATAAPTPHAGLSEMASLFKPRIQWAGL